MYHEEAILAKHLAIKNDSHTLIQNLKNRYSLSLAEAESLDKEIRCIFKDSNFLNDGQEFFTAISSNEPPGKPLTDCCSKRIKLTIRSKDDLEIRKGKGIKGYLSNAVSRLAWQALEQDALLTQEDLAFLLNTSRATIKRIISHFRLNGDFIPTRGNYHDIGPGLSHKYEAVKLYIKGLEPTDICRRLGHSLHSIERYIKDFALVISASLEDYNALAISRFTKISEKVVREYLVIYDRFTLNPQLKPLLDDITRDFRDRGLLKKNIEERR